MRSHLRPFLIFFSLIVFFPLKSESARLNVLGPPVQPKPGPTAQVTDDPLQDAIEDQKRQGEAYQQLNALNPMNPNASPLTALSQGGSGLSQLQAVTSNPFVRFSMRVAQDPEFLPTVRALATSPNRNKLAYAEGALYLFFFVFRTLRGTKKSGVFSKLWFSTWTLFLLLTMSSWVLPRLFFGDAYGKVTHAFFNAAKTQWGQKNEQKNEQRNEKRSEASDQGQPVPQTVVVPIAATPVPVFKDPLKGIPAEELNRRLRAIRVEKRISTPQKH